MGEHQYVSPLRPRQVRNHITHLPADNLLDEIVELDESINPRANLGAVPQQTALFHYSILEEQAARAQKKNSKQRVRLRGKRDCKTRLGILHEEWNRLKCSGLKGKSSFGRLLMNIRAWRECRERKDRKHWEETAWDFGEPKLNNKPEDKHMEAEVAHVIREQTGPCLARVEDGKDYDLDAEGLQKTEVTMASTSNPGVCENAAPLKHRHINKKSPFDEQTETLTNADILMLQQAEDDLDDIALGTQQPEIAVGADTSIFTQATDPFKAECIAEIL